MKVLLVLVILAVTKGRSDTDVEEVTGQSKESPFTTLLKTKVSCLQNQLKVCEHLLGNCHQSKLINFSDLCTTSHFFQRFIKIAKMLTIKVGHTVDNTVLTLMDKGPSQHTVTWRMEEDGLCSSAGWMAQSTSIVTGMTT